MNNDFKICQMDSSSIKSILNISELSFPVSWSLESLESELDNKFAKYVVLKKGSSIVGYGGMWVIIDEAQNLSPKQVKTIITRVGEGTKLILIGDPEQIDHPFLDSRSNGLCFASEKMKGSDLCYQVTLKYDECERSPLAYEGSKKL